MILSTYSAFRSIFAVPAAAIDLAGYPVWPVANLRINAFATFTGVPRPVLAFPVAITCNGSVDDGGAAFDWYLSQRTDETAKQYLRLTQPNVLRSGSVSLGLSSLAYSALGISLFTQTVNEDQLIRLFKDVTLYCQRRSDKSIQLLQLLPYTLGTS